LQREDLEEEALRGGRGLTVAGVVIVVARM
jgi:hypothetical protein